MLMALVEITEFRFPEISPEALEKRLWEEIAKLPFVPIDEDFEGEAQGKEKPELIRTHIDLLKDFVERPFVSLDDRFRKFDVHPEYGMRIIKDLREMSLLTSLQPFGLGRGQPPKSAFVTPEGADLLLMNYKDCVPIGKGSAQHIFLQNEIKKKLYNAVIEFRDTDIVQYHDDGTITAYEIELTPNSHVLENIKRDAQYFHKIVVLARNKEDLKKIKSIVKEGLEGEILQMVEVKLIKEILNG